MPGINPESKIQEFLACICPRWCLKRSN